MLSFELSDFMWARGRTAPMEGMLRDADGKYKDITESTLVMLFKQGTITGEMACTFKQDLAVASRACPDPDETYPNDDLLFGDAAFDFPAVLLPGAFAFFQKDGDVAVHSRRIHFVNEHYITLFEELPSEVDDTWNWWAYDDDPTLAKRGMFKFTPNFSTMEDGPFDIQAKLTENTLVDYSRHLNCRIITPIS